MTSKNIAIIGAGNGGQALAGSLALAGRSVVIYDCFRPLLDLIRERGQITLEGCIEGVGKIKKVAYEIGEAVENADVVFIVTTADSHKSIAKEVAKFLKPNQTVILSPGRTGGALEFRKTFLENGGNPEIKLGEAQTLVYACRQIEPGRVNIIGVKERVMLAGLPASQTKEICEIANDLFGCFVPVKSVLTTSLENIGAMFHPSITLFNAATIERAQPFYFYRDMTKHIASFIEKMDAVRLAIGRAYHIDLIGVSDWIDYAYPGTKGETLCEKMQNNPAYYDILAPTKIDARQLSEDVPTGILPMAELGRIANVDVELYDSIVVLTSNLLGKDFRKTGRNLHNLGLEGLDYNGVLELAYES